MIFHKKVEGIWFLIHSLNEKPFSLTKGANNFMQLFVSSIDC